MSSTLTGDIPDPDSIFLTLSVMETPQTIQTVQECITRIYTFSCPFQRIYAGLQLIKGSLNGLNVVYDRETCTRYICISFFQICTHIFSHALTKDQHIIKLLDLYDQQLVPFVHELSNYDFPQQFETTFITNGMYWIINLNLVHLFTTPVLDFVTVDLFIASNSTDLFQSFAQYLQDLQPFQLLILVDQRFWEAFMYANCTSGRVPPYDTLATYCNFISLTEPTSYSTIDYILTNQYDCEFIIPLLSRFLSRFTECPSPIIDMYLQYITDEIHLSIPYQHFERISRTICDIIAAPVSPVHNFTIQVLTQAPGIGITMLNHLQLRAIDENDHALAIIVFNTLVFLVTYWYGNGIDRNLFMEQCLSVSVIQYAQGLPHDFAPLFSVYQPKDYEEYTQCNTDINGKKWPWTMDMSDAKHNSN